MGNQPESADSRFNAVSNERVLVLDFGSQYAQLIARRVREQHVFCEIVRHDISAQQIKAQPARSDSLGRTRRVSMTVALPNATRSSSSWGLPILGICYGMQLACQALGGRVDSSATREYGPAHCASMPWPNRICSTVCRTKWTSG